MNSKSINSQTGQNSLQHETSPYLLQHADNPVAWHAWNNQALEKAQQENKPILLSIGYSACHWCHVMAHESFEDEETAVLMNEHFINIKIDREERPDIDRIYQTAQHMLTERQGGWPLTMFLTPDDHIPFFGGTYFPKEPRFGLPGFKGLLLKIEQFYKENREDIRKQNESLKNALTKMESHLNQGQGIVNMDDSPLQQAYEQLTDIFDKNYGGFGNAPKFPHPSNIEQLLHYAEETDSEAIKENAVHMALFSLEQMARGGIYDHLGGGFARYSVDQYWLIPHFEKMLYDNGPLLSLYSETWLLSKQTSFKQTAIETAKWTIREMQSTEGGYYSSFDADSEGEEGKFYVWQREEVQTLLDESSYALLAYQYGLENGANFEGQWHLFLKNTLEETATKFSLSEEECQVTIERARNTLFNERKKRTHPGRDDKILTSWNALMIKGMATAGRIFNENHYIDSACRALDFIHCTLWKEQRLFATYKDSKAHLNAYLDDYAFLLDAILQLLQSRWRTEYLNFAIELAETLLQQFEDTEQGGFFFTGHDHEKTYPA